MNPEMSFVPSGVEGGVTIADYRDGRNVQDAPNLSGVVRSFVTAIDRVRKEHDATGHVGDYRRHPVLQLYACAIIELCGAGTGNYRVFERTFHFSQAMESRNVSSVLVEMPESEWKAADFKCLEVLGKKWVVEFTNAGYTAYPVTIREGT